MIYLYHGDNSFATSEALFLKIGSSKDIGVISGNEISDLNTIFSGVNNFSLFPTETKVIVVKHFFTNRKKSLLTDILSIIQSINPKDSEIYFWETSSVDKRSKLYKYFQKNLKIQEFKLLSEQELISWAKVKFEKEKINIQIDQIRHIIEKAGTEQQILSSEIEKLVLYIRSQNKAEVEDADLSVISSTDKDYEVWQLMDAIASKNKKLALSQLNLIMKSPNDFPYLISMISRQLKILYLLSNKEISRQDLTEKLKIHPFVIAKASKYIYKFNLERIKILFSKIVDLDFAIKQGRIEPILGLNLFIASI